MKKRKVLGVISFVMIFVLLAAACAKKDASTNTSTMDVSYEMPAAEATYGTAATSDFTVTYNSDTATTASGEGTKLTTTTDSLSSTSSATSDISSVMTQDKIIRTFFLEVETQGFDGLITQIGSEVSRLGGYIESSNISGKRYYYSEEARNGSIVARIPVDKVDEFVGTVDGNANIVNKQESSSNVSLEYIDAESRVETLKIEQERLFAILEDEVTLENIITLESRLSDIRYELQNYESKLRYYDNQVAYSTVTMNIQEVEKLTPVTEEKQSVGTRIKNGFSNTIYKISEGLKDFFVWFVVNLPYLLIWGIIIAAVILITRRILKKQRAKTTTPPPSPTTLFGQQENDRQS